MNTILEELKKIVNENIKENLIDVKPEDLEENGAIYYMNGKNGTDWDYYVNEHLSPFMVFYNDKENLGAIKLNLFTDGYVEILIYNEKGKNLLKKTHTTIDKSKEEIFKFAVLLENRMDDNFIWDANIDKIDINTEITIEEIVKFQENEKEFEKTKNRLKLMNKTALVSRKILDEGYKIGLMAKDEPMNNNDSGWQFLAGNEDEEYRSDYKNIALLSINEVNNLDQDIFKYLENPVGIILIRTSKNTFEEQDGNKEILIEKR